MAIEQNLQGIDFRTPAMKRKSSQYAARDKQKVRTATYRRDSTRHQDTENQKASLERSKAQHPEWDNVKDYVDEHKSATTVKNRNGFKQMIKDIETEFERTGSPPFNLLVCAELCRFSRSLSDTLHYIDILKRYNVEVYFIRDDIYTFSTDASIKLGIYSGLAASESAKVRERVNDTFTTLRSQGQLFGSGNILGYDLFQPDHKDKRKNTYVKNADAPTVYQIYKWYIEGNGEKKICSLLTEGHYTNTQGKVSWSPNTISRLLQCKTFAGYKSYLLSETDTDGFHERHKLSEADHIYIKGDWEPIIPLDMWEEAQRIRKSKLRPECTRMNQKGKGKKPTSDVWMKALKCDCGKSFAKFKWRVNHSGEECFGYQCRNIVEHRRKSFHIANGLSGEGRCDVKSIPEWKLQYQFMRVLQLIWVEPDEDVKNIEVAVAEAYVEEDTFIDETPRITRQIDIYKTRMATLVDKYLDGMISEDIYNEKYNDLKEKIRCLEAELQVATDKKLVHNTQVVSEEQKQEVLSNVRVQLEAIAGITKGTLDSDAIAALVPVLIDRVTPTESGEFRWYLALGGDASTIGFDENNYILVNQITIKYDEARNFRKAMGSYLRVSQWQDISLKVFVRV